MDYNQQLLKTADLLLEKGDAQKAYSLYLHLAKNDLHNETYRLKLGEACVALNRKHDALKIYKHLAANLIKSGDLIRAISVNKRILEIDASDQEIQKKLKEIYAEVVEDPTPKQEKRREQAHQEISKLAQAPLEIQGPEIQINPHHPVTQTTATPAKKAHSEFSLFGDEFENSFDLSSNLELANSNSNIDLSIGGHDAFYEINSQNFSAGSGEHLTLMGAAPIKEIPKISLFSDLPAKAFSHALETCKRFSVPPETVLVKQGEASDSIFIVAYGTAKVLRRSQNEIKEIAQLKSGDFFGEFAYFSKCPREATLVSTSPLEVLEFTRQMIDAMILEYPKVERAMFNLYKERVLNQLLKDSDLFSTLSDEEGRDFATRFSFRPVEKGKSIIKEGDLPDAFYLVQFGSVVVTQNKAQKPLAVLREGDFFGEYAMVTGKPRTASVTAQEKSGLVVLTKEVFRQLINGRPKVWEKIRSIAHQRLLENQNQK